jgi:hypothetical protein
MITFEDWWETYTPPMYSPLDSYEMEKAYEAGWDACREKWSGMTYNMTYEEANDGDN